MTDDDAINTHDRIPLENNLAPDEDCSSSSNETYQSPAASPQPQPPCTSLQPIPSPIPSPSATAADDSPTSTASTELAHERQTLLLMLLGQVCSLHDATPRTFVVHVIALYERGILDSSSIQFLFDLGLVPRGYDLSQVGGDTNGGSDADGGDEGGAQGIYAENVASDNDVVDAIPTGSSQQEGAIVPYCAEAKQHPWTQYIPPPPLNPTKRNSSSSKGSSEGKRSSSNSLHSMKMAHRQKEALAMRKHLERHESIDSSGPGGNFGSSTHNNNAMEGIAAAASSSTSSTTAPNLNSRWNRANSSVTQNTLTSAEESFDNPSFRPHHDANLPNEEMPNTATQVTSHMPPTASWSVEHHPLSLSRYQREFHQISLLATGSFGAVYHAIHKLEQRPYAVKCVTFSTMGYYANTLALVIREVRCLATVDHPNCVRYYTSWLEPSWMTGDQKEAFENDDDDEHDNDEYDVSSHPNGKGSPKLLTDIERVIEGLHQTEEIDASVEQLESELEAILYGGNNNGGEADDGFNWASSSSAFTFDRTEQKESHDESSWGNLPSHQTSNYHSLYSRQKSSDSEGSEWTQVNDNSSSERDSFHNSQVPPHYARQGSVELVPNNNERQRRRQQFKKKKSSSSAGAPATYKYQISLYIQMQLCNPSTLADWIKHRNGSCTDFDAEERQARARPAFEVFRQIVNGLAHVHSKEIIHRDLKPANIFAGDDGSFMIGDFGLSKTMRDANNRDFDPQAANAIMLPRGYNNDHIHTAGVGTASYASPEQTTSKTYGTAADIFSLGLVLLELFSNFTSEHERAKAFHDCRHDRELSPWMKRYYPEVSALILACTQTDWSRRPSASDIQAAGVFQEKGNGAEIFRAELSSLKVVMKWKDTLIQKQREQIFHLKRRLAELETGRGVNGREAVDIDEDSSSCSSSDEDSSSCSSR